MTRLKAEHQAKLQYILASTRKLFKTRPVEDCTMEEIATAAQYTRRTLYSYFNNRDELYLLIHMEDLQQRWKLQQQALDRVDGSLQRIRTWAEVLSEYWREHPQAMQMGKYWDFYGVDPERISPEIFSDFAVLNDELADGLRDLFNAAIADKSLRPDLDVDLTISQFLFSVRAVIRRGFTQSYSFTEIDPDTYLQHFLEIFLRGISKTGETS